MGVTLADVRKVAVIQWTDEVSGAQASIEVENQEKRTVKNDGESNLFFPLDFSGPVTVTVRGSHGGVATDTVDIP